jgi:hypothetical protein
MISQFVAFVCLQVLLVDMLLSRRHIAISLQLTPQPPLLIKFFSVPLLVLAVGFQLILLDFLLGLLSILLKQVILLTLLLFFLRLDELFLINLATQVFLLLLL